MQPFKILTTITQVACAFLLGVLFFAGVPAFAQLIDVDFQPDPLFEEVDYLPGDEAVGRSATVHNVSGEKQLVVFGVNNLVSTQGLERYISLAIGAQGDELWSGTLADIDAVDYADLGDISEGETIVYDISALVLSTETGGEPGGEVRFDIWFGFRLPDGGGSGGSGSGGVIASVSSGGGGGYTNPELVIMNTRVESVVGPQSGGYNVGIAWDTNIPATSQVVYGPADQGYVLNPAESGLGYPFLTSESAPGVSTQHSMLLSGLAPGIYKYRVVSRAGTWGTSPEYTFQIGGEVLGAQDENRVSQAESSKFGQATQGAQHVSEGASGLVAGVSTSSTASSAGATLAQVRSFVGSDMAGNVCSGISWWPVWVLYGFLVLVLGFWTAYRHRRLATSKQSNVFHWAVSVGYLAGVVLAVLFVLGMICVWKPWVALLLVGVLVSVWQYRR